MPNLAQNPNNGSWKISKFYHSLSGDASSIVIPVKMTYKGSTYEYPVSTNKDNVLETDWTTQLGVPINPNEIALSSATIAFNGKNYIIDTANYGSQFSGIYWTINEYTEKELLPYSIQFIPTRINNFPFSGSMDDETFKLYYNGRDASGTTENLLDITNRPDVDWTASEDFINITRKEGKLVIELENPTPYTQNSIIAASYCGLTASLPVEINPNYSADENTRINKLFIKTTSPSIGLPYSGYVGYSAFTADFIGDEMVSEPVWIRNGITWEISHPSFASITDGLVYYNVSNATDYPWAEKTFLVTATYNGKSTSDKFIGSGDPNKIPEDLRDEIDTYTFIVSDIDKGVDSDKWPFSGTVHLKAYHSEEVAGGTISSTDKTRSDLTRWGFLVPEYSGEMPSTASTGVRYKIVDSLTGDLEAYYDSGVDENGYKVLHYINNSQRDIQTGILFARYGNDEPSSRFNNTFKVERKPDPDLDRTTYIFRAGPLDYKNIIEGCTRQIVGELVKCVDGVATNETLDLTSVCTFEVVDDHGSGARFSTSKKEENRLIVPMNPTGETYVVYPIDIKVTMDGYEPSYLSLSGIGYNWESTEDPNLKLYWDDDGTLVDVTNTGIDDKGVPEEYKTGYYFGERKYVLKYNGVDVTSAATWSGIEGCQITADGKISWNNRNQSSETGGVKAMYGNGHSVVFSYFSVSKANYGAAIRNVVVTPGEEEFTQVQPSNGTIKFTAKCGTDGDVTEKGMWYTSQPKIAKVADGVVRYANNSNSQQTIYVICNYGFFYWESITGASKFKIKGLNE